MYKSKFHKGIFEIISPFISLNLLSWNYILEYFVFNLFILDYIGLFSFGFRLSVHLDFAVLNCVDRYSEGQFGHIRYYK